MLKLEKIFVVLDPKRMVQPAMLRAEQATLHQGRPELLGKLERLVDLNRLRDVDGAVFLLRRIIELAKGGVAGARVIPGA